MNAAIQPQADVEQEQPELSNEDLSIRLTQAYRRAMAVIGMTGPDGELTED